MPFEKLNRHQKKQDNRYHLDFYKKSLSKVKPKAPCYDGTSTLINALLFFSVVTSANAAFMKDKITDTCDTQGNCLDSVNSLSSFPSHYLQNDLYELVSQKISVDSLAKLLDLKKCDKIIKDVAQTIKTFLHAEAYISGVLKQTDFKIICTDSEHIKKTTDQSAYAGSASAYFNPSRNQIVMNVNGNLPYIVNHEFLHAYYYSLHSNDRCRSANPSFPLHPVNSETVSILKDALDKGDHRVR